jgi:hypothetical protein
MKNKIQSVREDAGQRKIGSTLIGTDPAHLTNRWWSIRRIPPSHSSVKTVVNANQSPATTQNRFHVTLAGLKSRDPFCLHMRFVLERVQPHAAADRVEAPATGSTTIAALWRY